MSLDSKVDIQKVLSRLPSFNALLRARGFSPSADRWQAAGDLLLRFHTNQSLKAHTLCAMLAPLFCSSREDQEHFHELFYLWQSEDDNPLGHTRSLVPSPIHSLIKNKKTARVKPPWFFSRAIWTTIVLSILVISCLIAFQLVKPEPSPISSPTPSPSISPTPEQTPAPTPTPDIEELPSKPQIPREERIIFELPSYANSLREVMYRIALSAPWLLVISIWFRRRLQNQYVIKREENHASNPFLGLELKHSKSLPFALGKFTTELRRSGLKATRLWNLRKTVDATIKNAGFLNVIHINRHEQPEYLILINRPHSHDHLSTLADNLLTRLHSENLNVQHYYFYGDPRYCYRHDKQKVSPIDLEHLAVTYPRSRLIVIGQGKGLFHPINQTLYPWTQQFSHWKSRVWLTNKPQPWGFHESQLAQSGFLVAPFDSEALSTVAVWLRKQETSHKTNNTACWLGGKTHQQFPISLNSDVWTSDDPTFDEFIGDEIKHVLSELKQYLSEDEFFLLSACAAYPEVHGKLTIGLDQKLFPSASNEARERRLLKLSALPWSRTGRIPTLLRQNLLYRLDKKQFKHITSVLNELFTLSNSTHSDLGLALPKDNSPNSENHEAYLQDQLTLKVLKGRLSRLDYLLPEKLSRPLSQCTDKIPSFPRLASFALLLTIALSYFIKFIDPYIQDIQSNNLFAARSSIPIEIHTNSGDEVFSAALQEQLYELGYGNVTQVANTLSKGYIISSPQFIEEAPEIQAVLNFLSRNQLSWPIELSNSEDEIFYIVLGDIEKNQTTPRSYLNQIPDLLALYNFQESNVASEDHYRVLNSSLKQLFEVSLSNTNDPNILYESLVAYRAFNDTATNNRSISELDKFYILRWYENAVVPNLPERAGPIILAHIEFYLDLDIRPLELDPNILSAANSSIRLLPTAQLDYLIFKDSPENIEETNAISPLPFTWEAKSRLAGTVRKALKTQKLYTSEVFRDQESVVNRNSKYMQTSNPSNDVNYDDFYTYYRNDYINHWESALRSVEIGEFSSLDRAIDALELASDSTRSPILAMLNANYQHTAFDDSEIQKGLYQNSKHWKPIQDRFATINQLYIERESNALNKSLLTISEIAVSLQNIKQDLEDWDLAQGIPNPSDKYEPIHQLKRDAQILPSPVKDWMLTLAKQSESVLIKSSFSELESNYQEIYNGFNSAFNNRYPFDKKSDTDVNYQDFIDFFGPGGILEAFEKNQYEDYEKRFGSEIFNSEFYYQFANINYIRKEMFSPKRASLEVEVPIKPIKMSASARDFTLQVGKQRFRYSHGPMLWKQLTVTGENIDRVQASFSGVNGAREDNTYDGQWAWFRFMDDMKLTKAGNNGRIRSTFSLYSEKNNGSLEIELEFRNESELQSLLYSGDIFSRFNLPERITVTELPEREERASEY